MTQQPYYPPQPPPAQYQQQPQYPGYPPAAVNQQPQYPAPAPGYAQPPAAYGYPAQPPAPPAQPLAQGSLDEFYSQPNTGGGPAVSWKGKPDGYFIDVLIARDVNDGDVTQETDPQSKQPKWHKDGRPRFVMQVPLKLLVPDQAFPEGEARLFLRGQLRDEWVRAMSEAGAQTNVPQGGARARVTLVYRKPGNSIAQNIFAVQYWQPGTWEQEFQAQPPQPFFQQPQQAAPQYAQPPVNQYAPQQYQPPAQQYQQQPAPQYQGQGQPQPGPTPEQQYALLQQAPYGVMPNPAADRIAQQQQAAPPQQMVQQPQAAASPVATSPAAGPATSLQPPSGLTPEQQQLLEKLKAQQAPAQNG